MKTKTLSITIPASHLPAPQSLAGLRTNILELFDFGDWEPSKILPIIIEFAKQIYAEGIECGHLTLRRGNKSIVCKASYKPSDFIKGSPERTPALSAARERSSVLTFVHLSRPRPV